MKSPRPASRVLCIALLPLLLPTLSGCASMDEKTQSAGIGAALGCAAGAVLAHVTENDVGTACAAGAVIGGAIGYMRARNAEVEAATVQAAEAAKTVPGAVAAPVKTETVAVKDKASGKTDTVQAFKSVSVDIPNSQIHTKEGKEALRKLNDYARKVAMERGETVDMSITSNAPDKNGKSLVGLESTREAAGKGAVVRSIKYDTRVPANVQRVSIEVKNPQKIEV